jgi:hypothetical protein
MTQRIPVREMDYLDEDKPIKGQNYVLMSFISPEDVLQQKEVFFQSKFLDSIGSDISKLLDGLSEKYKDDQDSINIIRENHAHFFSNKELQEQYKFFKSIHLDDMDKEFYGLNEYKTSIRGIKVRGVFDTVNDAKIRAEVLKRMGDKFDIFVGQVGCWCPWSPNPEDLQDQEYAETELNTLMKKYKENMTLRDVEFEERKTEKMEKAKLDYEEKVAKQKEEEASASGSVINETIVEEQASETSEATE